MKKKLSVIFALFAAVLFTFAGCGNNAGTSSRFISTDKNVYDFYYDGVFNNQMSLLQNLVMAEYETTDDMLYATQAMTSILASEFSGEEIVMVAVVQCFNSKNNPKVEYLNMESSLIFVEQKSPGYNVRITSQAEESYGQVVEYNGVMVSKGANNIYDISYQKQITNSVVTCSAKVQFDASNSYFKLNLTSYNSQGSKVELSKEMIQFRNEERITRATISTAVASGSWERYLLDSYTTSFKKLAKLSKLKDAEVGFGVSDLDQTFVKTSTNDKAGFMYNYDSSTDKPSFVVTKMTGSWMD